MVITGAERADLPRVERAVLEIVDGLLAEVGGRPERGAGLHDSLDRDLGLGSLERVELLVRLEEAFGVRLPDTVVAAADNPGDLVAAVLAAGPATAEGLSPALAPLELATTAPAAAATLPDVLRWHAEAHPERVHIFLRGEDGEEQPITYGALLERATAVASALREHGLGPGESVALMLRTEPAFFPAFFGALLAGAVPVPIYPPFRMDRIEEYAKRQVGILRNAGARALITFGEAERVAGLLRSQVPSLREVSTVDRLLLGASGPLRSHGGAVGDHALIQYTSGSTGAPKGVLLTHANILANIRAIGEALAIRPDDVAVSWLPLYHDMGLIGSWLGALYFGIPIAILSPLAFLARPARWLWTLHAHRGTISPAPNFAFDLCLRKVADEEIRGLDLSAWRLALNGSEPVSPETIERFTRRFSAYGFRAEAMCPVYGLAESSVALTASAIGSPPRVDRVARGTFQQSRQARPAPPGEATALRFVGCGRPLPGHEVRVMDRVGRPLPERVEGRIEFRGPSVMAGYWRNPEATSQAIHDGWVDSGDLGYWADGELFITGRAKDIVIKAGRNLYPQEVEEVVGDMPGVRKGCVAAFGVPDPTIGTERLVVVAESREKAPAERERLRVGIIQRVVEALGIPPDVVVVCVPGTVLKTPSGKVRRSAMRESYLRGRLGRARPSPRAQWARLLAAALRGRIAGLPRLALSLAVAGWAGLLLALTLPALWGALVVARSPHAADRLARFWCRAVLALSGCRLHVKGLAHLAEGEAAVLVANHASYLDAVVLLAAIPTRFSFVAKRELAVVPVVGTVIRKVGHLTVERADAAQSLADAERATALLRGGTSLLFFPEGTFVRGVGLLPFRLGAFKAAVETGQPVIPVAIRGTRDILPADTWLPRPAAITVTVGAPLRPRGSGWPEMVRLRDEARAAIAHDCGEPPLERRPLAAPRAGPPAGPLDERLQERARSRGGGGASGL